MNYSDRQYLSKTLVIWFAVLVMASLVVGLHDASAPVSVSVFPEVPVEGQPILVTFNLNNPSIQSNLVDYELYANGKMIMEGATEVSPLSNKKYQYTYLNSLEKGEQVTFVVKSTVDGKNYDEYISLPAYPPQVWSSFVSFASFSTSVMSYMTTMTYYDQVFENGATLNVSIIFSIVLIGLLIYLELTEPSLTEKSFKFIGNLRIRFSKLSTILFVIFIGMVFTQVALIIGKVG
ncbi:hypothetical protein [uncultured Methanomethylovorans sp.]|uniref:hypothetical protein n=1 Tax=uncultured Methanomethylovorans sp. TaxID=183759 RepID=UPI002AA71DA3|nr:hypothetical protein [uncultured Methanomethylovorans sp.]